MVDEIESGCVDERVGRARQQGCGSSEMQMGGDEH
jgi:hypothetical protein